MDMVSQNYWIKPFKVFRKIKQLGRVYAWLDTGTHDSILATSNYIHTIEEKQGLKMACLEEIAFEMGYILMDELLDLTEPLKKSGYGQYLIKRDQKK